MYFWIKPHTIDPREISKIAQLEFDNFTAYQLENDYLKMMIYGQHGARYSDETIVEGFATYVDNGEEILMFGAKKGYQREDFFTLEGDVNYYGSNAFLLQTQLAVFDIRAQTLDVKSPFLLEQANTSLEGSALFFNHKSAKLTAKDIRAKLDF